MLGNLAGAGVVLIAAILGYQVHQRLFASVGNRWAGRLAAYLLGAIFYGIGIGAMQALVDGGWHRSRSGVYSHTSALEGLVLCAILGVLGGFAFFVRGERRGGRPIVEPSPPEPEFPPSYVASILSAESEAPAGDRAKMATHLRKRAEKSRQPLPAELAAFVERNAPQSPSNDR